MTSAYFDKADLEARLSATIVQQIYDDNNDGTADASPIARLIADASSEVDSFLRPIYPLPLPTPVPNEVKRLALDVAEYRAAQRFPEIVRKNWQELRKVTIEDLNNLRKGVTRLDVPTGQAPDPPANAGATVGQPRGTPACTPSPFWADMGDFSR